MIVVLNLLRAMKSKEERERQKEKGMEEVG
jgi:hypothetical protein